VSDRLDDLVSDPEPLQRATNEGARRKLVFEAGVILGTGLGHDARAVGVDDRGSLCDSILSQTGLQQEFLPANVLDSVLGLDPKPEGIARLPEFWGRIRGILHDGKPGWLLRKIFHHFLPPQCLLNYSAFSPPPRPLDGPLAEKLRTPRLLRKEVSRINPIGIRLGQKARRFSRVSNRFWGRAGQFCCMKSMASRSSAR